LVPGDWFVKLGGGVGKESVAIEHSGRQTVLIEVQSPISILKSKAASTDDHWSNGMLIQRGHPGLQGGPGTKRRPNTEIVYDPKMGQMTIRPQKDKFGNARRDNQGNLATSLAVGTRGGGTQYYLPQGSRYTTDHLALKVTARTIKYTGQDQPNVD
jgi:hypothetical protein